MSSMDFAEKTRPCQDYIDSLEEERRKMEVFHRELPLSLQLISQVINGYRQKQQLTTESLFLGRSESEETSSEGPVLEEFIPLKQISSLETHEKAGKMADWLQLWNQDPSTLANEDLQDSSMAEMKNVWGGDKKTSGMAAASSSVETGSRREEKGQTHRKSRRCWSPKLHRQFLQALHQLGGSHATPKQIRELMKVDGLTNDEVKSHLQKYRLHTSRRPSPATIRSSMTQPQQFLVVGGLWVPPPQEYRTVMQPPMEPTQVYAPVPVLPSQLHQEKQTQRSPTGPLQWEMEHPNSNSSSSSSRTTTTSPAF